MQFVDAAPVAGTRLTADGYLLADARCVRTGIQHYRGAEVGLTEDRIVAVYRPEAEVFARDSLASFARLPVTVDHPAQPVTAENWKTLAVGETDSEVLRDGARLRIPLTIRAADAIVAIQAGKRELSAGYTCTLDWTPGVTPDGQAYEAVQRTIRANHLAIVARGRAGSECRIGDADAWGAAPITMSDKQEATMADALATVVLGDSAVQVAVADTAKIDRWKADQTKALADAKAAQDKAAEEVGRLKAELQAAKDAAPKPGDLDRMAAERAALVGAVQRMAQDVKPDGLTDADLRRAAVAARMGDAAVTDVSDAEVKGMFAALSRLPAPDPVRGALADAKPAETADADYVDYLARLTNAYKGGK